jgi:hypothetical protein
MTRKMYTTWERYLEKVLQSLCHAMWNFWTLSLGSSLGPAISLLISTLHSTLNIFVYIPPLMPRAIQSTVINKFYDHTPICRKDTHSRNMGRMTTFFQQILIKFNNDKSWISSQVGATSEILLLFLLNLDDGTWMRILILNKIICTYLEYLYAMITKF